MKLNVDSKIEELLSKVTGYVADEEGWKLAKKSDEGSERTVTIHSKPSAEFEGHIFKGEGIIEASPEQCFKYCDPKPDGKRVTWDKALKDLEVIEYLRKDDPEVYILRTMTHGAAMNIISARDFVDVVVNVNNDKFIGTLAHNIKTDQCPEATDFVRGTNYYCGILCHRIPGDLNKTKISYIAQSDVGGMVPRSLVESTLPSAVMDFFINIQKEIENEGKEMSF